MTTKKTAQAITIDDLENDSETPRTTPAARRKELHNLLTQFARLEGLMPREVRYLSLANLVDLIDAAKQSTYCYPDFLKALVELADVNKTSLYKALAKKRIELVCEHGAEDAGGEYATINATINALDDSWAVDTLARGERKIKATHTTDPTISIRESIHKLERELAAARSLVGDEPVDAVVRAYKRILAHYE